MGQKILKIPYSKYAMYILAIMGVIFFITNPTLSVASPIISTIFQPIPQIYCLLWTILVLLSVNKKAGKRIFSKFEFWFKMLYVFQYVGGEWLLFISSNKTEYYTAPILRTICVPISIVIFSCLDGLQLKLCIKITAGLFTGIVFTSVAVYYTCLSLELFDIKIIVPLNWNSLESLYQYLMLWSDTSQLVVYGNKLLFLLFTEIIVH